MGFRDNPKVDLNSERSEESVLVVRSVLSQKSGFICREETPDFGVDLTAELVLDGQASGRRFPIQVKSSKHPRQVSLDGQRHIAHQFLTSRLGYLCRTEPAYGVIVLYDDSTKTAYFDFVEEIYRRISARKDSQSWQDQETVTIHIPCNNVLDTTSAKLIHKTFRTRFENHALLVEQHGSKFEIPLIRSDAPKFDPDDPNSAAEYLKRFGNALINNREFQVLFSLLGKVTHELLESSAQLSCIAAIGFAASGRILEADYFIRKANRHRSELSEEECMLLDLYASEVGFRFGRLDAQEYLESLSKLNTKATLVTNQLAIAVTIDRLCILRSMDSTPSNSHEDLVKQVLHTERAIKAAGLENRERRLFLLRFAENLHQLALNWMRTQSTALRIQEQFFGSPNMAGRRQAAKRAIELIDYSTDTMEAIYRELQEDPSDQETIMAHLEAVLASTFFSFAFNIFMLKGGLPGDSSQKHLFFRRLSNAIDAYNSFIGDGSLGEAYSALLTALEIRALYREVYAETLGSLDETELTQCLNALSEELGKPQWNSVVKGFVEDALPAIRNADSRGFRDQEPERDEPFARTLTAALRLPEDRVGNIVADIRAIREFAVAFPEPSIELLQDLRHTQHRDTMYAEPVAYTGVCMKCQYSTRRSKRVSDIISNFLSEHGRSCPQPD